ncbi:hypothetical protein [Kordia sp.]|uniref:hypothetical protein n=1 Tax=Kordia sp. TaxID=1965332 RepID=UPI003D6C3F26
MSTIISTTNCGLKEPLSKFDDNGSAAIINYNLPQAITYDAYSYLDLELSANKFNPNLPYDTFWERTANLGLQEIVQLLLDEIDHAVNISLFENSYLLYKQGIISRGKKRLLDALLVDSYAQEQASDTTGDLVNKTIESRILPVIDEVGPNDDFFDDGNSNPYEISDNPSGGSSSNGGSTTNTSSNTGISSSGNTVNTNTVSPTDLIWQFGDINLGDLNYDIPSLYVLRLYSIAGVPLFEIAAKIKRGFKPVLTENGFGLVSLEFISQPETITPTLEIVLNFKMRNHLGNYGAGKVIKTMSLLPGETSNISVRNWQRNEVTKKRAENILDSFSESSMDDLQNTIENENILANSTTRSETRTKKKRKRGGLNLGIVKFGGRSSASSTKSFSATTASQVRNLAGSTSKQSSKTDALREIEVNVETTETLQSETEQTIVRELKNINQSRVLNFTFRQLLQEYISIIYLDQVSILFTNGNDEIEAKLEDMDDLLETVLTDTAVSDIKNQILAYLCNIKDYQGNSVQFVEKITETYANHLDTSSTPLTSEYVRKRTDLEMEYADHTVSGIIFDVTHRTIRTDALIAEALLGQGETLDCYNIKLQNEAVKEAILNNNEKEQALKVIDLIEDPIAKAELYKKVFGDCCDVPQNGLGGIGDFQIAPDTASASIANLENVVVYNEEDNDGIDEFRFRVLNDEDDIILSSSKKYTTKELAYTALKETVEQIINDEGNNIQIKESKDNRWYFTVTDIYGKIIGKKMSYPTKTACEEAVGKLKEIVTNINF